MNDNAISRAIAHTHFVIAAAIAFCLLVITLLYLSLSSGLHLDKLKLGPVYAEQLYLKWDNALTVQIGKLTLPRGETSEAPDLRALHERIVHLLAHADDSWIGSIGIDRLVMGDTNASLYFDPRGVSTLRLATPRTRLGCTFTPVGIDRTYLIEADAADADYNATLHAKGALKLATGVLHLTADANVSNRIFITAAVRAGERDIRFNAYSRAPFDSVAPLVVPLGLHPETRQWIVERAQGGPVMLHTLRSVIPYAAPERALGNLYGHLTFENARYNFSRDPAAFEPAIARQVSVIFKEGRLNIIPIDATFYAQSGGSTWLDIDFNPSDPVLNLHLNTRATLTAPLHRLIKSYGIDLPLMQTSGTTDASLTLNVNLASNETNATGHFSIPSGRVDFSGLPIDINATDFSVRNADVTIHSLQASLFEGNVTAAVTGSFNPAKEDGVLHFNVTGARYGTGDHAIGLSKAITPLRFEYVMDPQQDMLSFNASHWEFGEHNLSVGAFDAPFRFGTLEVTLPETPVRFDHTASALLHGTIRLGGPSANLDLDLTRLEAGSFRAEAKKTRLHIDADTNLSVSTATKTYWRSNDARITVDPFTIRKEGGIFKLSPAVLTIEHQLAGTVQGIFDPATMSSELNVSAFRFEDSTLKTLFQSDAYFNVYIVPMDDEYDIILPSLNMLYSTVGEGWKLHFFSLDAFRERSPLLNEYNLTQSSITFWSEDGKLPITFKGAVQYPYALTIQDEVPVTHYSFNGSVESNSSIDFTVNDRIGVTIGDTIRIRSDRVKYNLPELVRFYREHRFKSDTNDTDTHKAFYIDANDTAIVFTDGREALADRIAIQYELDRIYAQLFKAGGGAMLEVRNRDFYLYGDDLDDEFMEHFFRLSKFKGGKLQFYVIGDKDAFNGLVRIDDTTVYDYVLLNNLFAFINTVPALVTFSLPSYESKGIRLKSAYAELKYQEGNMTVSGIKVDSKEMDFAGQGVIDYNTDTMQMELSVKTQAGDNIRKIPLVGYILVGDDQSVLTTVSVSGSTDDPRISSTIAKDIIIAPFNLLKRTLNFPVHYLEKLESIPSNKPKEDKSKFQITSGTPPIN